MTWWVEVFDVDRSKEKDLKTQFDDCAPTRVEFSACDGNSVKLGAHKENAMATAHVSLCFEATDEDNEVVSIKVLRNVLIDQK